MMLGRETGGVLKETEDWALRLDLTENWRGEAMVGLAEDSTGEDCFGGGEPEAEFGAELTSTDRAGPTVRGCVAGKVVLETGSGLFSD